MNKQTFDQFRERARGVRLPDNVRDNVLSEMSAEKNRAPQRRSSPDGPWWAWGWGRLARPQRFSSPRS